MPTNTSSERSGEAERSEGLQDTCYQVPLCPFASWSSSSLFHGWSVSGSLEHQGKQSVPLWPVPLSLLRAAGVRVWLFRLVIAPSGCTAVLPSVIRPYPMLIRPREARARRGYRLLLTGRSPGSSPCRLAAAQPSPRSGSSLSFHRSPRRPCTIALRWRQRRDSTVLRSLLRPAAAACQGLTHRVRGGRSGLPCRRTIRPRVVLPFAPARLGRFLQIIRSLVDVCR